MYKKLFILALLVFEVKSDCEGFECFGNFFTNFFDNAAVQYNATVKNLPENFVQVKDFVASDLNKVLSDISSFITQDITEKLKSRADAVFSNVNPETKVYVKTFDYNHFGDIDFEDVETQVKEHDEKTENEFQTTQNTTEAKIQDEVTNTENKTEITTQNIKEVKSETTVKPKITKHKHISENEIPKSDDINYYDSTEDNSTDYPIIDYVELYKDTTNEENIATESVVNDEIRASLDEYTVGLADIIWDINNNSDSIQNSTTDISEVYPWIATIFIKNDTKKNQFEYYCDGALLSDKIIITAARCVNLDNSVVDANDLLVILGKRSLLAMDEREKTVKIKKIITHENFTNDGKVENDLALLLLEDSIEFNDLIQPAPIGNDTQDVERFVTTAWDLQGDVVPVYLDDKENHACNSRNAGVNMFCATFGLDVALCPSYGGVFAAKQEDGWFLYGIRSGDPTDRGLCVDKHVWFTDLRRYETWIHLE